MSGLVLGPVLGPSEARKKRLQVYEGQSALDHPVICVKPSELQSSLPTPWCTKNRPSGS
jgi:hypothetical protein